MPRVLAVLAGILLAGATSAEPVFMRFAVDQDELVFVADDIAATAESRDQSGQPAVMITLAEDASAAFAIFTRQSVGKVVDVFVCDVLIVSPTVVSEISGGQVMLAGSTADVAAALENRLRLKSCK